MDPSLDDAYRRTTYVASTPAGRLRVRAGHRHPDLDAFVADLNADQWAHMTAWNPGSRLHGVLENHERQRQLEQELCEACYPIFRGSAVPDSDDWDPEESVLVIGISKQQAVELGGAYGQNAIVWGRTGEAAEIVWCPSC